MPPIIMCARNSCAPKSGPVETGTTCTSGLVYIHSTCPHVQRLTHHSLRPFLLLTVDYQKISTMLRAIALLFLLMCVVKADVKEASTKDCELLDPEHQQALREQLQKDSCLREVEAVEPHEIKRAGRLL